MRRYYVFRIRKEFVKLYRDNPVHLFNNLRRIFYSDKKYLQYNFNLYNQITEKLDKDQLDRYLYIKLHNKMFYIKKEEQHIINNLYKDEVSILEVKNSYIVIEVNNNYSMFFEFLNNYYPDYFVCDFHTIDYFWLNRVKTLV